MQYYEIEAKSSENRIFSQKITRENKNKTIWENFQRFLITF